MISGLLGPKKHVTVVERNPSARSTIMQTHNDCAPNLQAIWGLLGPKKCVTRGGARPGVLVQTQTFVAACYKPHVKYAAVRSMQVIRGLLGPKTYVIVVEHDLSVLDYLSDYICCLYGKPGAYGVVTMPFGCAASEPCFSLASAKLCEATCPATSAACVAHPLPVFHIRRLRRPLPCPLDAV